MKTVAAFLNSHHGGTLVIGVTEGNEVVGLEHDYTTLRRKGKHDADLFQLHLNQLIENSVGLAAAANVTTQIHHVDGHDICRVHVEPSGHPIYAEVAYDTKGGFQKRQAFFIRLNNATREIEDQPEVERYIAQRWGQRGTTKLI